MGKDNLPRLFGSLGLTLIIMGLIIGYYNIVGVLMLVLGIMVLYNRNDLTEACKHIIKRHKASPDVDITDTLVLIAGIYALLLIIIVLTWVADKLL